MNNPIKAATVRKSFGAYMEPRFIVTVNKDAAEIMGETKIRYVFASQVAAEQFATVLQSNLDAAYADACGE
jgi:predicted transcriptional regulator